MFWWDASPTTTASAGHAAATAAANGATGVPGTRAPAGHASATGAAYAALPKVSATAGHASATGVAYVATPPSGTTVAAGLASAVARALSVSLPEVRRIAPRLLGAAALALYQFGITGPELLDQAVRAAESRNRAGIKPDGGAA